MLPKTICYMVIGVLGYLDAKRTSNRYNLKYFLSGTFVTHIVIQSKYR